MTREEWLNKMVSRLKPRFEAQSATIPALLRVSIGFPSRGALSSKHRRIGECWNAEASSDEHHEIFLSPLLDLSETCSTLMHELVHACLPPKTKHGPAFKRLGEAVGLTGRPSSMSAGPTLAEELARMAIEIGPWPASCLNITSFPKTQGTRLIKVECASGSGYCARVTRKWIDKVGTPICPCHQNGMIVKE